MSVMVANKRKIMMPIIISCSQLPGKTVYMNVTSVEEAWAAIRNMNVRLQTRQLMSSIRVTFD